jgi:diketogulonate reductase-like aldo/keto reductase
MGSWQTFDVAHDEFALPSRVEILRTFFERGGALIDSSPMYGSSEKVIGQCLDRLENDHQLFSATKVWTHGQWAGKNQMENSRRLWGVNRFDLMQIHNLLDWQVHLETLKEWKQEKKIRYLGITTSHGRRHSELLKIMERESLDFVQFTYNLVDREAEQRLLPVAIERGIAVIINRPFQGGNLFSSIAKKPLPGWAGEINVTNWAQFFLKFIVSHPGVTCAIPATSQVSHMQENMGALYGALPDKIMRKKMLQYFDKIAA